MLERIGVWRKSARVSERTRLNRNWQQPSCHIKSPGRALPWTGSNRARTRTRPRPRLLDRDRGGDRGRDFSLGVGWYRQEKPSPGPAPIELELELGLVLGFRVEIEEEILARGGVGWYRQEKPSPWTGSNRARTRTRSRPRFLDRGRGPFNLFVRGRKEFDLHIHH